MKVKIYHDGQWFYGIAEGYTIKFGGIIVDVDDDGFVVDRNGRYRVFRA